MSDTIRSKEPNDAYREGWERIFGGKYSGPERRKNPYNPPSRPVGERRRDSPFYEPRIIAPGRWSHGMPVPRSMEQA